MACFVMFSLCKGLLESWVFSLRCHYYATSIVPPLDRWQKHMEVDEKRNHLLSLTANVRFIFFHADVFRFLTSFWIPTKLTKHHVLWVRKTSSGHSRLEWGSTVISGGLSYFCNSWWDSYAVNYSDWAWQFQKENATSKLNAWVMRHQHIRIKVCSIPLRH